MNVHLFESTGEAYDRSQYDDTIKDGDILVVASEGVVGFLYEAWPVAVVYPGDPGAFHIMAEPDHPSHAVYEASIAKCKLVAEADADITGNDHWREVA